MRAVTVTSTQQARENIDLDAYNGAFWDLGFKWQWDGHTYRSLLGADGARARIRLYLERHQSHLFKAYDPDFLVDLIHERTMQRHDAIMAAKAAGKPVDLSCNALKAAK